MKKVLITLSQKTVQLQRENGSYHRDYLLKSEILMNEKTWVANLRMKNEGT